MIINQSLSDKLVLTQKIGRFYKKTVSQTISLEQNIDGEGPQHLKHRLSFQQYLYVKKRSVLAVSDTLLFSQTFTTTFNLLNIAPYNVPQISDSGYFKACSLSIPASGLSFALPLSIVLPAPDFGDVQELNVKRINRKNFGNLNIIARPPIWGTTTIYHLTFSNLNNTQQAALQNFYLRSFGAGIVYTDYKGQILNGIITTPYLEFVEVNNCTWKVSFDFSVFGGGDG